ncbi:MAG: thioredoxin domain-containing protein, partial [Dehalococcoidia bacterium]|nr:thioredoxin domain-containing protein [Dehalococcoidia bacterium]
MFNRLANETSPYLLQHKDNPVDWYPWCDEAFETARSLDRPIILSIGYSACHWCHVMAHECFENELIARAMNNGFVNIKVDREELPDVDSIYMTAVQAMTGSGGWPLTVFITPDGKPFFGGTYFPPADHHNRPGFPRVLDAIADAYKNNRAELLSSCEQLVEVIKGNSQPQKYEGEIDESLMFKGCDYLLSDADLKHGGSLGAPKFPQPMLYELLLRYAQKTGNSQASHVVNLTLEKMAEGGIYDQIGGGFARYSVDDKWLVPHFEKMLYDNAQLVTLYVHAYQMSKKPLFKKVIEQTLGYVVREMTHSMGGFYSSSDADSEGVEGKFFVWTPGELDLILKAEDALLAKTYWQVTEEGNFEGANILNVPVGLENFAREHQLEVEVLEQDISRISAILFQERSRRVPPGIDDKILTSWNALMFKAFAEAGALFQNPNWIRIAEKNVRFLLTAMKDSDGRLLHSWKAKDNSSSEYHGGSHILAYLDDHAYLIDALITLYEATFDYFYLEAAENLADSMVDR